MNHDVKSDSTSKDSQKTQGAIYTIRVPPSLHILGEVRALVVNPSARVDELSALIHRDPVIVVELLRISNSVQFSAGRPPATSVKAAIERLGAEAAAGCLDELRSVPQAGSNDIAACLEAARQRCVKTALVGRILAEVLAKTIADECTICALLIHYGEMLAAVHLGADYAKLAGELNRVKLLFRLEKDYKFDPLKVGINYLRRFGVPEAIMFGIDAEAQTKTPGRGAMKMITQAAAEMAIAFESDRWDKLAPGSTIPPKSPIRLLGLSDQQYQAIYEKAGQALQPQEK